MDYCFLTNDGLDSHPELVVESFDAKGEQNDYEVRSPALIGLQLVLTIGAIRYLGRFAISSQTSEWPISFPMRLLSSEMPSVIGIRNRPSYEILKGNCSLYSDSHLRFSNVLRHLSASFDPRSDERTCIPTHHLKFKISSHLHFRSVGLIGLDRMYYLRTNLIVLA